MALEWVVLGYAAGLEAAMLIALTLPGLGRLRRGMVSAARGALRPMLSVVPFCAFLALDIYWKQEALRAACGEDGQLCTPSEHLRHQRSAIKWQRNALLIAATLLFYWLLFSVTNLLLVIDQLDQRIANSKKHDE